MNLRIFFTVIFCSVILLIEGCVSTARVAVLSKTAVAGLQMSQEINYSFSDYCVHTATLYNYKKVNDNKPIDIFNPPDCGKYKSIDSAKNVLLTVLLAYFQGLQKLSDDGTVDFSIADVTKYLKKGSYLGIEVGDKEISSVNTIAAKLLAAIAGGYRNNKIKEFITGSDDAVGGTLTKLGEFYQLLITSLENEKGDLLDVYTVYIKDNSSKYQQMQSIKDYTSQVEEVNAKEKQVKTYIATLNKIRNSHHEVATKANTMSKQEWQQLLTEQASEIFSLINEFKNL